MTTIAYKEKILAADSACIEGETCVGGTKKVWRVGKCLIGICGELTQAKQFVEWYKTGADDDDTFPLGSEFDALVIAPDGTFKFWEGHSTESFSLSKKNKYVAIGSGSPIALGCMHHGGTAVDAVKAAIAHDRNTRGPVRVYRL